MENVWLVFISEIYKDQARDSVHSVHIREEGAEEMVESLSNPKYGFNDVWSERWAVIL